MSHTHVYDRWRDGYASGNEAQQNPRGYVDDLKVSDPEIYSFLHAFDARLRNIERCLGPSSVVQATPISHLVCMDITSRDSIRRVYDLWIDYMNFIARQLDNRSFASLFWATDKYIFQDFFQNSSFGYEFIKKDDTDNDDDEKIIHHCLKETKIQIYYNVDKIHQKAKSVIDYQYDNDNSLIGGVDTQTIPISAMHPQKDRRIRLLGSHRILYNTVVDTTTLRALKASVNEAGKDALLNVCLLLLHAMLHVKCFLSYGDACFNHSNRKFVTEIIQHVPPVFYGHPLLPIITLSEKNDSHCQCSLT